MRIFRRPAAILRFAALAVVVTARAAAPAAASDCPGMEHYTYDGGECTDRTGDTTDVLIESDRQSLQLGLDMIARSRPAYRGSAGHAPMLHGPPREFWAGIRRRLFVDFAGPTQGPERAAARSGVRDPVRRRELIRTYRSAIDGWRRDAGSAGFDPAYLPDARTYFVVAAYHALDGRKWDPPDVRALQGAVSTNMSMNGTLVRQTNATKRDFLERYAMIAYALERGIEEATHDRSAVERREMHGFAERLLRGDLGVEPAAYARDRLPCALLATQQFLTCDMLVQLFRS